jgi:hypothetical protein
MGLQIKGIEMAKVLDLAQRSKHVEFKVQCGSGSIHFGIYDAEVVKVVSEAWNDGEDDYMANIAAINKVRHILTEGEWEAVIPEETHDGKKSPHTFHLRRAV